MTSKESTNRRQDMTPEEKRLTAQLVVDGASEAMTFIEAAAILAEYASDEEDPRSVAAAQSWRSRPAQ